jgi:uncharacterized delta-60 repeat protein
LAAVGSGLAATLDPGFGKAGVVETPLPEVERQEISESNQGPLIRDLAIGRHGELVAAIGSGNQNRFFGAASYRADGTQDLRFGGDGFVNVEETFPGVRLNAPGLGFEPQGQGVAVQRNGRIVLVGYQKTENGHAAPIVMRLLPSGHPDTSFGEKGLIAPAPRSTNSDELHAVAIQPGGRIVAVGARNEKPRNGPPAGLVVAYRSNGRIDRGFGDNGRVLFFSRKNRFATTGLFGLAVLPNSKILVTGYRAGHLFVARLGVDGNLDRRFGGGDGEVSIDLGLEHFCCSDAAAVSALPNGSSVVLADSSPGLILVRLRSDGSRDSRFGRRGIFRGGAVQKTLMPFDIAIQANGRIVAVGANFSGPKHVFTILRFRANGKLDRAFGNGGIESLPLGINSVATSAVVLPSGRVVVGGGAQLRQGKDLEYMLMLARLGS